MDWKLHDINEGYLQDVNCQYDSLDLADMLYNAEQVLIDFKHKKAIIIKKKDGGSN